MVSTRSSVAALALGVLVVGALARRSGRLVDLDRRRSWCAARQLDEQGGRVGVVVARHARLGQQGLGRAQGRVPDARAGRRAVVVDDLEHDGLVGSAVARCVHFA